MLLRLSILWRAALVLAAMAFPPVLFAEEWVEPISGITFVRFEGGCFQMGLPPKAFEVDDIPLFSERIQRYEMPAHEVCIEEFWMARHETTEAQWLSLMEVGRSSLGGAYPVTGVSWDDAMNFAERLTRHPQNARDLFRLPTEAEWEVACRAGGSVRTELLGQDQLAPKAWFSYSYSEVTSTRFATVHPVGEREANPAGLLDMLGNAWEWTLDPFHADAYARRAGKQKGNAPETERRSIRGGSFQTGRQFIRCEARSWHDRGYSSPSQGFRLLMKRGARK